MRFESAPFPRFNLSSMSGVYAGTRSDRFYRLRLWRLESMPPARLEWFQLQLPPTQEAEFPSEQALHRVTSEQNAETLILSPYQPESSQKMEKIPDPVEIPIVQLSGAATLHHIHTVLVGRGMGLHACLTCRHWQRQTASAADELDETKPAWGHCRWQSPEGDAEAVSVNLSRQSALALGCAHWDHDQAKSIESSTPPAIVAPDSELPVPESAISGLWSRLRQRLSGRSGSAHSQQQTGLDERSGVGAGTEPCFACHGRLANLGALVVESEEGDPLTFSVWRCRVCRTTYLNRWADRWVRMDNLETDESYFRIAPVEADKLLRLFHSIPGADHPKDRRERTDLRQHLEALAGTADLISRQIKQGR